MGKLTDRDLDTLFRDAAAEVELPAPDMRASIVAAIREPAPRRWTPRRWAPPARLASVGRLSAAAALLAITIALGALIVNPGARTAVGEFFGIVEGQRIEIVPTAGASPTVGASPFTLRSVAQPVSLSEAEELLPFVPGLPDGFGTPDAVYVVAWGGQPLLILHYPAFDLWQTDGPGFFDKQLDRDAIDQPLVNGQPAWWIDAVGHQTAFFDADGHEVKGSRRSVDDRVLAWNGRDGRYYRMETDLSLEEALAIAEDLP